MRFHVLVAASLLTSLSLPAVADAAPGELRGVAINSEGNNFGYWEYLPAAYDESQQWPVLIFLSGIGENGDGTFTGSCSNDVLANTGLEPFDLCHNLRHGPQRLIWDQLHNGAAGSWNDAERPFIVIAPQNPAPHFSQTAYDVEDLDAFVQYVVDNYAVDPRRMYLVGMSMGGRSTLLSLESYPDRFAAASIMPGFAPASSIAAACSVTQQNIWAFHGENDTFGAFYPTGVVSFIRAFNDCPGPHPVARMTMYTGAGHNVWTQTLDLSGMTASQLETFQIGGDAVPLDAYDVDIYSWLLSHDKPDVDAGADLEVSGDLPSFELSATTLDEDAIVYTWTQTSGGALPLTGADSETLTVSDLQPGEYAFEVLALDADGQHDRDTVLVTVTEPVAATSGSGDEGANEEDSAGDATAGEDAGTSGSADEAGMDGGGNATTGAGTGSDTDTEGKNDSSPAEDGEVDAGCGCSTGQTNGTSTGLAGLLIAFGLIRRRRNR